MSTAAGGEVIVGGAILSALGLAAMAAVAGGAVIIGGCYLVCKGGCRAVAAGKQKWQEHIQALESARQQRLEELREEDERRMQNLQNAFRQWAQQGQDMLRQQEKQIRQEMMRQQSEQLSKQLEAQRKAAAAAAAQQHMEMMDQELRSLQDKDPLPLITEEAKRNNYQYQLKQGKAELEKLVNQYQPVPVAELSSIRFDLPVQVPSPPPDTSDYSQRLAINRAQLVALVDLADAERQAIQEQVGLVERSLTEPEPNPATLNSQLARLEEMISEAQNEAAIVRQNRQAAWDDYFSLYDHYITASNDAVFKKMLADPLAKLGNLLDQVKEELVKPGIVAPAVRQKLQTGQQNFETEKDKALQSYQDNINKRVQNKIIAVLGEMDYKKTEVKEQDGAIRIKGKGSPRHPGAEITLEISPEGYLSVDLSGKGFRNQQLCDAEFLNLQTALHKHGIQVDLTRCKKTWLEDMQQFFTQEFQNQGYAPADIQIDNSTPEVLKIFAYQAGQLGSRIEINRQTGEVAQSVTSGTSPIATERFFAEEEAVEERVWDEQTIRTET